MSAMYENIFREFLKDFRVSDGGEIFGFCSSSEEFEELQNRLKSAGFSYSVRRSSKCDKPFTDVSKSRYYFQHQHGNVSVDFFGPASCIEAKCSLQCTLGPRYYKKKDTAIPEHLEDHVIPKRKRMHIMDTKKSDCPATIFMKCIRVFPEYVIESPNSGAKTKVLERLRKDLVLPQKPKSFLRYYVVASPASMHTHATETVETSGKIHPLLVREINKLVQDGTTSVRVIKLALDSFVNKNFVTETAGPSRMNTTFYPTDRTIYNHVYRALYVKQRPIFDHHALQNEITEWRKDLDNAEIYFRPVTDADEMYGISFRKSCSPERSHEESSDEDTNVQQQVRATSDTDSKYVRARELCNHISNLTHNCKPEYISEYLEVLENLAHRMEATNPKVEGLPSTLPSTSKE